MDTTLIRCPQCQTALRMPAPVAPGKKLKCPKCGGTFTTQASAAPAPPSTGIQARPTPPDVAAVTRTPPAKEDLFAPSRKPARKPRDLDDDDDDDVRPRRGRRAPAPAGGNLALVIGLIVGGGVLFLVLAGVAGWLLMKPALAPVAVPPPVAVVAAAPAAPAPVVGRAEPVAPVVAVKANDVPPAADAIPLNVLQDIKRATAYIKVEAGDVAGTGSGFLMKVNGDTAYVITNYHVVSPKPKEEPQPAGPPFGPGRMIGPKFGPGARGFGGVPRAPLRPPGFGPGFMQPAQPAVKVKPKVTVVLHSGTAEEQSVPAQVVAFDAEADLAALRITGVRQLPRPIDVEQQPQLVETMPLYVFGFPFGKALATNKGNPAVTIGKGSISSLRNDEHGELSVVQVNGDINPGNSGGPVVDAQGRLVGISVAHIPGTQIGLAIPSVELTQMLKGRIFGTFLYKPRPQPGAINLNGEVWVFDRKNRVRNHETINLQVPGDGAPAPDEFGVEVLLTDPMHQVRSAALHYARSAAPAPTKPNAAGLWDPLAGAQQVELKLDDQRAHGTLNLPAGPADEAYVFQLAYVNTEGRTIHTQPHVVRLNFPKANVAGAPAPGVNRADAVTLNISGVPDETTRRYILETLPKLLGGGTHSVRSSATKDSLKVELAPVPDPKALAAKIDFGQVTAVADRTITVVARKMTLPPPPAADVASALDDLNSADAGRRKGAAERLAKVYAPLPERRAEVAKALEPRVSDSDLWTRRAAVRALAVWGGPETVPALCAALKNSDLFTRQPAAEALGKIKDPAAAPALAELLPALGDRGGASNALKAIGPPAQGALFPLLEHQDLFTRAAACDVLREIGTADALPLLTALADRETNGLVKNAAREAIKAIEARR